MPSIITKTTDAGDKKALTLDPVGFYRRKTNLPADWKIVRVGLIMSLTNATDDNGTPLTESFLTDSVLTRPVLGFASTDAAHPYSLDGLGSVRFVGLAGAGSVYAQVKYANSLWTMAVGATNINTFGCSPLIQTDSSYLTYSAAVSGVIGATDPTAGSNFACGYVFDVNVATAGILVTRGLGVTNVDPRPAGMNNLMATNVTTTWAQTSTGWWSANTPVDCPWLYIRFPFRNNRVRLLGVDVRQTY